MPMLVFIPLAGQLFAAVMTLICLARAANMHAGAGYAARQLVLAVLLTPLLFLGVFLMPVRVRSDLMKWDRVEEFRAGQPRE